MQQHALSHPLSIYMDKCAICHCTYIHIWSLHVSHISIKLSHQCCGTLALYVFVLARARLQRASDTRTAHSPQNVYKIISFTKFDVAHANKINLDIIDKSQGHNVYAAWDRGWGGLNVYLRRCTIYAVM